ncbi:MAG TPA: elongation factor 1-beta [Desulfurococcales archaeon]|nr:elongation factor 1-beta [Desulfurococcales archaeon]
MAKVLVTLKIFPKDINYKPEDLVNSIKSRIKNKNYEVVGFGTEPIAFGLSALILNIVMPEEVTGGTEELETIVSKVEGVSQVEVVRVTRIS